ncbi:MAG TPA: hypothetical protein VFX03_09280 [Thermomicrobiales bacterium]|nr:hypothetical protein [Thermomicrobiales bacterium]
MATQQGNDLDVKQDVEFQRREWRVQRIGWIVILAILAAAALGLFGSGPLSQASVRAGPITVAYSRFDRRRSPTELNITIAGASGRRQIELWIDRSYLDHVNVERISPPPQSSRAGDDRTIFVFALDSQAETAAIGFAIEPEAIGRFDARLGLTGGQEVAFWQLFYP